MPNSRTALVLADAALDHYVGIRHGPGRCGIGRKFMRVLIRIVEDTRHLRRIARDLLHHAPVKIFGGDDIDGGCFDRRG